MRGDRYTYNAGELNGYSISSFSGGQSTIQYYLDYRVHYLELPIMYCIDLSHNSTSRVHVFFSAGFSAGINVVSKIAQNNFTISSPGSAFSGIDENNSSTQGPQTKPVIVNFVTDLNFEFRRRKKTKIFAYCNFNQSLTNVFSGSDMKTKVISYGFGFGLRWYLKGAA
jgi:hypothetical protein